MRVLHVDRDWLWRDWLCAALVGRGHVARSVDSAAAAADQLERAPQWPDVVVIGASFAPRVRDRIALVVRHSGSTATICVLVHDVGAPTTARESPSVVHRVSVSSGASDLFSAIERLARRAEPDDPQLDKNEPAPSEHAAGFLVVEDEPIQAGVLRAMLSRHRRVTVVDKLRDAIALVHARSWTGIVIDLGLPDGSGLSLLRLLRRRGDATPALVLTATATHDDINAAQDLGAEYVVKPPSLANLERFVLRALADETIDDGDLTDRLSAVARRYHLSPRETEIVGLAARGADRAELATALRVSENTLKAHIRHALRKTDVRSYAGLARLLLER